jgi:carboxymethylenebutenolidase
MKAYILIAAIILLFGCTQPTTVPDNKTNASVIGIVDLPSENQTTNYEMLSEKGRYNTTTSYVVYYDNVSGYLAKPKASGDYPGVILIHEWWGLNDEIKGTVETLASHGYSVLAVDLFNGSVATTPEQARAQVSSLNQSIATANMKAALAYLRQNERANKTASMGWCFGGGQSMQLALSGEKLDATVIYYGSVVTDENQLKSIEWPVLGVFGDQDQVIPVSDVKSFNSSLDNLSIENEIYLYSGVGHAFANPSGANYAPNETKDAWNKTTTFLDKNLK